MTVDNRFLIKKFEHFEHIFVLFSQTTRLPFIECDEETFDDQVYVFTDEERIKEAGQKYFGSSWNSWCRSRIWRRPTRVRYLS